MRESGHWTETTYVRLDWHFTRTPPPAGLVTLTGLCNLPPMLPVLRRRCNVWLDQPAGKQRVDDIFACDNQVSNRRDIRQVKSDES